MSLELHDALIFWRKCDISGNLSLYIVQICLNLKRLTLEMHILCCKPGICRWNHSAEVSLMLVDLFPVPFFIIWNMSASILPIIVWKLFPSSWLTLVQTMFFKYDPRCFGPFAKFQHNIQIFIWTARVSRLSLRFLGLWWNLAILDLFSWKYEFSYLENELSWVSIYIFTNTSSF